MCLSGVRIYNSMALSAILKNSKSTYSKGKIGPSPKVEGLFSFE